MKALKLQRECIWDQLLVHLSSTLLMGILTDNVRKRAKENMPFADGVDLCGKEKQDA